ncbi:MAG: hypothetical protein OQK12_12555 [Motiliproteus sp.]|nr:hypothetical protein [Motiliproteus sp.]MCW9053175.1 hypothetical protein [Motiliproteus sp.]
MDNSNRSSAMIIAYHFPPISVSSGVHRMISLANAFSEHQWDVSVLTANKEIYDRIDEQISKKLHANIEIHRAKAFNTAKHLSIAGKYLQAMALPDRLQSWILFSVVKGLFAIRKRRPDFIISTYPIASAHAIGLILHKITGIPWIADFRDPMAQEGYPANKMQWKSYSWLEKQIAKHARLMVFATPGCIEEYQTRFPSRDASGWYLMPNGYDESAYADISVDNVSENPVLRVLHSGVIYPFERNPNSLFEAIHNLKSKGFFSQSKLRLMLRATGHDDQYNAKIEELGIGDIISVLPPVPYHEAVKEMFEVDGLLLLQGSDCNSQIPAKAYEYIRARKPILALTDENGDTAKLLKKNGVSSTASLYNAEEIEKAIEAFFHNYQTNSFDTPNMAHIQQYDRAVISGHFVSHIESLQNKQTTDKAI